VQKWSDKLLSLIPLTQKLMKDFIRSMSLPAVDEEQRRPSHNTWRRKRWEIRVNVTSCKNLHPVISSLDPPAGVNHVSPVFTTVERTLANWARSTKILPYDCEIIAQARYFASLSKNSVQVLNGTDDPSWLENLSKEMGSLTGTRTLFISFLQVPRALRLIMLGRHKLLKARWN